VANRISKTGQISVKKIENIGIGFNKISIGPYSYFPTNFGIIWVWIKLHWRLSLQRLLISTNI